MLRRAQEEGIDTLTFALKVATISASGAMSPGPLTAVAAASGVRRRWKGGFMVSVGHTIVELPLVLLLAAGVLSFVQSESFVKFMSFAGGAMLLFFAYLTAKSAFGDVEARDSQRSPLLAGVALTLLNPFFIAWWATIGAALVAEAVMLAGYAGIAVLYISHVWLDFAWLTFVASVASFSAGMVKVYRTVLLALAILVAIFGADFIYYSLNMRHLIL
ncbi:MAG: LysE family transporter [Archaeoglobaceae archaeon]